MRIGAKLGLGFLAVILLTAVTCFVGYTALNTYSKGVITLERTGDLSKKLEHMAALILRYRSISDVKSGEEAGILVQEIIEETRAFQEEVGDPALAESFGVAGDAMESFSTNFTQTSELIQTKIDRLKQAAGTMRDINSLLKKVSDQANDLAKQGAENSESLKFAIAELKGALLAARVAESALAAGDPWAGDDIADELFNAQDYIDDAGSAAANDEITASLDAITKAMTEYRIAISAVSRAITQAQDAEVSMVEWRTLAVDTFATVERQVREGLAKGQKQNVTTIMGAGIAAILMGIGVALFMGRNIGTALRSISEAMERLSKDDLDVDVPMRDRTDEVGAMATAMEIFKQHAIDVRNLSREEERRKRIAEEEKRESLRRMADDFEQAVGATVASVRGSTQAISDSASQMSDLALDTQKQSGSAASATDKANGEIQAVAAASEELAASIADVNRQVGRSAEIASNAMKAADETTTTVSELSQASNRISDVLSVINEIAEQTNLLALNATIEAARAGEAGKGFAVVAGEVKNLATQTAKATEEIAMHVEAMQRVSKNTVNAIQSIGATIKDVNDIASAISSAVEQQDEATREIARSAQSASGSAGSVSENVSSVQTAANDTGSAASQISAAIEQLSGQADDMVHQLEDFLVRVRQDETDADHDELLEAQDDTTAEELVVEEDINAEDAPEAGDADAVDEEEVPPKQSVA